VKLAEKLLTLAIRAADALEKILRLHELLEIALEQGEESLEKRSTRVELLLESYVTLVEPHLDEIELQLKRLRQQLSRAQGE